MRRMFIHLIGMVSFLFVGIGVYLMDENEFIGLTSSEGVYVFILGALMMVAAMSKLIPNQN